MCGIVGYAGNKNAVNILIEGLKKLEYRGYDSAGVAVISEGILDKRRNAGKIADLEKVIDHSPLHGLIGIGHTRWATHGRPTEENAHPHMGCKKEVVVVQNGIIENYAELKKELKAEGHDFRTETDTEVIAHLLERYLADDKDLMKAMKKTSEELEGNYAVAAISIVDPDKIVVTRNGPPLVIGIGENENYIASDVQAILSHTKDMIFIDDNDFAEITSSSVKITDFDGNIIERTEQRISWDPIMAEKGGYKHFMLKEIHEQPRAIRETIMGRIALDSGVVHLEEINLDNDYLKNITNILLIACGTAWHAALTGGRFIEALSRIPCTVDYGSEYRYRNPIVGPNTLAIAVSQSGETADTLAAIEEAKSRGAKVISVCNVVGSMVTRKSDGVIYTHAGPEIGVASTKAFTSQLAALFLFALYMGQVRETVLAKERENLSNSLARTPHFMEDILDSSKYIYDIAFKYHKYKDFLYLGRGVNYPLALEGALKLKEISYIHAEGYPGGEMKHGPIALIDENMPTVAIALKGNVYPKMLGNIEEVKARGGKVIAVVTKGDSVAVEIADDIIEIPDIPEILSPIIASIPLQLLAYHISVILGCDVDQPRNLAKSVTVE